MSYILDSLKKLEKEKSSFDNRLDIKKLILKDNSETNTIKTLKKRSHLLTLLILVIAVFFFLNFFVFKFLPPNSNPPLDSKTLKEEKTIKKAPINPIKNPVISLPVPPEISAAVKASRVLKPLPDNKKDNVLNAVDAPNAQDKKIVLVSKNIETEKEANENTGTVQIPPGLSDEDLDQRLDHIEQLIQKEFIPAESNKLTERDIEDKNPSDSFPSKNVSRKALPQDIVDLEVSGIVFFGKGASLNYAIASYKGTSQMKLKEGDRLDDIEVLEIQPEKILLIFEDKVFEKRLGN